MRVVVVGGGVVGLASAWELARAGADVTVLERGQPGGGASRGNSGWVCPSLLAPLAAPGIVGRIVRTALSPSSALYIKPRPSLELARFLVRFLRHSTARRYAAGVQALIGLGKLAVPLVRELADAGVDVGFHHSGILSVFSSEGSARHHLQLLAPAAAAGVTVPADILDGAALRACAPVLSEQVQAGYVLPDDGYLNPDRFVDGLVDALRSAGAVVHPEAPASAVERATAGWRVSAGGEVHAADHVVVAAGAWTPRLLPRGAVRLEAGKGYSFSVPCSELPTRPIHLEEAHVVATPMEAHLRVAGTMELSGLNDRLEPRRLAAIERAARPWLRGVDWSAASDRWVGPRPLTAHGLPLIGAVRPGLWVATGHGMYGVTLALATGRLLCELITGRAPSVDPRPFAPTRRLPA